MFRHLLPNAMVATLTLLPFLVTGTIGAGRAGFSGLWPAPSAPSLGQLTRQAQQNLQSPWLALPHSSPSPSCYQLLVFIFEGVRDAFDPRKTFQMSVLEVQGLNVNPFFFFV